MSTLTAEDFLEQRFDLPDDGRWTELVAGEVHVHDPPDEAHGTAVLNLGRAISEYVRSPDATPGSPAFNSGLVISRRPDTVLFPAVAFYTGRSLFDAQDDLLSESPPAMVVDVVSTPTRRRSMGDRVQGLLEWGVDVVWILDVRERQVRIARPDREPLVLDEQQNVAGEPVLEGFAVPVAELFAAPEWWSR